MMNGLGVVYLLIIKAVITNIYFLYPSSSLIDNEMSEHSN